jgi:translation initiation factor 1
MGRKERERSDAADTPSAAPFHNPFAAALGGLRDGLPPGAPAPAAVPPAPADEPADKPAGPREAVLHLERKGRGGKDVTRVELRPAPPAAGPAGLGGWLGDLKRALGCGGSVEDGVLYLQGDQRERLAAFLKGRGLRVR